MIHRLINWQINWMCPGIIGALVAAGIGAAGSIIAGNKSAKAAKSAASTQAAATREATAAQERALQQTRQDLQPFRQVGEGQIDPLTGLVDQQQQLATDPQAQLNFVQDNPFFNALADESQRRIFQNQAARGKVGSGETAEALQNSILLLGNDLINQQLDRSQQVFGNRLGITQLGANAAARQGQAALSTGTNIANLTTQRGNALAAGQVGAANARTQGINQAINAGLGGFSLFNQNQGSNVSEIDTSTIPDRRQLPPGTDPNIANLVQL